MFRALRFAFSLLRIPRLFATIILFPLLLSLLIVAAQLIFTASFLKVIDKRPQEVARRLKKVEQSSVFREFLFGSSKPFEGIQVCRWSYEDRGDGLREYPGEACAPDRLDAAIQVLDPQTFDSSAYEKLFLGNVERLHICQTCVPDIIIDLKNDRPVTTLKSLQGLVVLSFVFFSEDLNEERLRAAEAVNKYQQLLGAKNLELYGLREAVHMSALNASVAVILSIATLGILTFWLAMRAHRKVLDYFARSGALLPIVASVGKKEFYTAIWLITLFRVLAFLAASVPLTIQTLRDSSLGSPLQKVITGSPWSISAWLLALLVGFALATLVASLADLKHREQFTSFLYRYVPILICFVGAILWLGSFLFEAPLVANFRDVLTSLPLLGMLPVMLSPLVKASSLSLLVHATLSAVLVARLLQQNSRWLAAHLEAV